MKIYGLNSSVFPLNIRQKCYFWQCTDSEWQERQVGTLLIIISSHAVYRSILRHMNLFIDAVGMNEHLKDTKRLLVGVFTVVLTDLNSLKRAVS